MHHALFLWIRDTQCDSFPVSMVLQNRLLRIVNYYSQNAYKKRIWFSDWLKPYEDAPGLWRGSLLGRACRSPEEAAPAMGGVSVAHLVGWCARASRLDEADTICEYREAGCYCFALQSMRWKLSLSPDSRVANVGSTCIGVKLLFFWSRLESN